MKRRLLAVMLAGMMGLSLLSACGSSSSSGSSSSETSSSSESGSASESSAEEDAETVDEVVVEKPETITVMVDGTIYTEDHHGSELWEKLEEITGIHFEVTQPDHSAYYDVVGQTIASGDWPDVMILNSTYYAGYAQEGVLWDMTDAYEGSALQERVEAAGNSSVVEGMKIDGRLYGMPFERGNGCITYVKQSWLDYAGLEAPTTYDEYIEMLTAFSTGDPDGDGIDGNTYGVSAAGFISSESPYVNYLPEFYQDAWPSFYQTDDGTWVDGFTEDAMKEALQRLSSAYDAGILDPQSLDQKTSDARNKFYSDQFGTFTYWAGTWCHELSMMLSTNGLDDDLVALAPIAEVPYYYDRTSIPWCITSTCENPEGVFEYFISAILDGGEVEILFTYGVEGVHWSTEAETLFAGTENEVTYEEGEFHMLENTAKPGTQYTSAHLDQMLAIVPITDDPGAESISDEAREAQEIFNENSKTVTLVPSTDAMTQYNGDLTTKKNELIALVVTGQMTVDEAYDEYAQEAQAWSDLIVESLNNQ
ncbi:MAG: extracellular solute-binding protein [Lachnospiraceae bacterium]|nr:extracellular solute-binding protein [Lachnospiraceae bacterium]